MNYDLHTHSSVSDGSLDPAALVRYAREHAVDVLSITDHDSVGAYADPDLRGAGVTIVPGIEISTTWMGRNIHIVGLGIDVENQRLVSGIARQQTAREQRAAAIAGRLERLGIHDPLEAVRKIAGDAVIGRPHFARHLVAAGIARDVKTAFRKYLGPGKPGDVRSGWVSPGEAVSWITASGGIAAIAHPAKYRMTTTRLRALVEEFRAAGGEAIEVVCGRQDSATTDRIARLARDFDLLASVGSDFHTPANAWTRPGQVSALPRDLRTVWSKW